MNLIKKILKQVLPLPFLKKGFLIYNKIKILTVDRFLFPEFIIKPAEFLVYRRGFPFIESGINLDDMPAGRVKDYMKDWYNWTQEEFILTINKSCYIEPDYGWAIVPPNRLIYFSLGASRTWFQRKPDLIKLWRETKVVKTSKAISLRDSGEQNYFHFFNDILSKLFFLQQQDIDLKETPVIVSKKLWDEAYFQFYFNRSLFLQSINWIVQDQQYILCDSVIFCKPLTHRLELWNLVLAPLKMNEGIGNTSKIFLTRKKTRLRFIENMEEVEHICQKNGFHVVDTDTLSPAEQIEIFSNAAFVAGIHGAGLTNMVFQKRDSSVLEIFPPLDSGYLPYHYIMLAKMLGIRYRAIMGEEGKIKFSGGFYLSPEKLMTALADFTCGVKNAEDEN